MEFRPRIRPLADYAPGAINLTGQSGGLGLFGSDQHIRFQVHFRELKGKYVVTHEQRTGFDILINGIPRTFRDRKDMAYDAARLLKSKNPREVVESVDRSTGLKSVMLADGRLG